ncbi:MAG: hypothetical protein ACTTJ9_02055, partial [Segatella oris]
AIFAIFYSSAAAEMQFLLFFTHPPWRKCNFCCFLPVRRGGKPIFSVFCVSSTDDGHLSASFRISSADDEHLSAIFAFRRPTTGAF